MAWGDERFPASRPRAARGGIRAQSQKGGFGESWWAKRWVAVLEGFPMGGRLQRGKLYARKGQVLAIEVGKGKIAARVQGSDPRPYVVAIRVNTIGEESWKEVAERVAGQALVASKLLSGEMPREMEGAFASVGAPLFPTDYRDLRTECSCPDASNPCKHIAAVYYLLGEEFDRDPFLIFRMRGMEREEFLELLGERGVVKEPELAPEPLPSSPAAFWGAAAVPDQLMGEAPSAEAGAAILRRLGKFPFWRGSEPLMEFLEVVYRRTAKAAAEVVEGEVS